jgi:hypothetical protein
MLPTIHGSASLQSMDDESPENGITTMETLGQRGVEEAEESGEEGLNIINSEDVPDWLKLYSQAPSNSDHLLNFSLFKLAHLEHFDRMCLNMGINMPGQSYAFRNDHEIIQVGDREHRTQVRSSHVRNRHRIAQQR